MAESPFAPGVIIAERYRVERELGRGGMGTVLRAVHTWTERPVALKVMQSSLLGSSDARARFLREARALGRLRHPNVLEVLDMGVDTTLDPRGVVFIAMELLEGEPLSATLEREDLLAAPRAVAYLLPILDALAAAHAEGFVHRDLKPDNIYLARDGAGEIVPKLLDFGIAKALHDAETPNVTTTGMVLGTPGYMSPEQASGGDVGPPSDVWAMGVVLFEALAGQPPFRGNNIFEVIAAILQSPPPDVRRFAPEVPEALAELIARCLRRETTERFADADELAAALRDAVGDPKATAAPRETGPAAQTPMARPLAFPATRLTPRPAPRRAALAAVVSLLALIGLATALWTRDDALPPRDPIASPEEMHAPPTPGGSGEGPTVTPPPTAAEPAMPREEAVGDGPGVGLDDAEEAEEAALGSAEGRPNDVREDVVEGARTPRPSARGRRGTDTNAREDGATGTRTLHSDMRPMAPRIMGTMQALELQEDW